MIVKCWSRLALFEEIQENIVQAHLTLQLQSGHFVYGLAILENIKGHVHFQFQPSNISNKIFHSALEDIPYAASAHVFFIHISSSDLVMFRSDEFIDEDMQIHFIQSLHKQSWVSFPASHDSERLIDIGCNIMTESYKRGVCKIVKRYYGIHSIMILKYLNINEPDSTYFQWENQNKNIGAKKVIRIATSGLEMLRYLSIILCFLIVVSVLVIHYLYIEKAHTTQYCKILNF